MKNAVKILGLCILVCLGFSCENRSDMPKSALSINADGNESTDWAYQIAYQRGIEAVTWATPAVSMIRFREAYFSLGGGFNTVYYLSQPPTPKTETLTANNQTGYATILWPAAADVLFIDRG